MEKNQQLFRIAAIKFGSVEMNRSIHIAANERRGEFIRSRVAFLVPITDSDVCVVQLLHIWLYPHFPLLSMIYLCRQFLNSNFWMSTGWESVEGGALTDRAGIDKHVWNVLEGLADGTTVTCLHYSPSYRTCFPVRRLSDSNHLSTTAFSRSLQSRHDPHQNTRQSIDFPCAEISTIPINNLLIDNDLQSHRSRDLHPIGAISPVDIKVQR